MKKLALIIPTILISMLLFSCSTNSSDSGKIKIAVGVVPEAEFVEKVAGNLAEVVVLVPPGNSPANYQPTAVEMQALSDADIYFTLQMPTEEANILPKVGNFNKNIKIVNLRDAVSKVYPLIMAEDHTHEGVTATAEEAVDPHLWLSPKRSIVMVLTIADELSLLDPGNETIYRENAATYIKEIEALDKEISIRLSSLKHRSFMIYHGSYGYFADDYNLEMISIEVAGKKATALEIQQVIEHALEEEIKIVFYQEEFDDNQAQTIAKEINGKVVKVAPLSKNYLQSLRDFIYALEHQED